MPSLTTLMTAVALQAAVPAWATEPPPIEPVLRTSNRATRDAALIIGNEAYQALPQASYAVADAHVVREWLTDGLGVSEHRVGYLENVGRDQMIAEIKRSQWRTRNGGTMWIYFAGHGTVPFGSKERVLLGVNADINDLAADGVTISELVGPHLARNRASRLVLILDAGFGNVGREGLELIPGHEVKVPDGFGELDPRVVVWAASRDDTPARAFGLARHGLFTWLAMGAVRGWADGELDGERDGQVAFAEAEAFTQRAARHLGRITNGSAETRPEQLAFVIDRGPHLEPAPSPDTFTLLAREDLERRIATAEARIKAEASAFWQDTLALAQEGGAAGREALEAYIEEFSKINLSVDWSVYIPEVSEARRVLARYDAQSSRQAVETAQSEPCDDLVSLEATAMLGELRPGQRACLESRVKTERLQTAKNKVSRLLLVNAEAGGDMTEWERLIVRHLEEIDRSDPDLCFRYAVFLHRTGDVDNAEEAIRWADYALENKHVWEPLDYVRKVYGLLRLRAEAAQRLWVDAERRYREDPTGENDALAREYRGWTMDYSREWLDYAWASGQPHEVALQLCSSAAGTADFCRARPR